MITRIFLCLWCVSLPASAQRGVPATARFWVLDDAGTPLGQVTAEGCFTDGSASGARTTFAGVTDSNGLFSASGETVLGLFARFTKDGYYPTAVEQRIERKPYSNTLEYGSPASWTRTDTVVLKRVRNPIPMYALRVDNPHVSGFESVGKYRLAETSAFDFVAGSFLPPHGQGACPDVVFDWAMQIGRKDSEGLAIDYSTRCEVVAVRPGDGFSRGVPDGQENGLRGSAYISDYEAPAEGYQGSVRFVEKGDGRAVESNDDHHYLYYFRIRTQTNEAGRVTNALYGKIYGQLNGTFRYFLNPTPNDRNIELDVRRNLFQEKRPNLSVLQP